MVSAYPSTVDISEMPLSYTGAIGEVSEGELDMFESTVTGAFSESGDQLLLLAVDDTEYAIQVMQSDLPSVHIVLSGTTLDEAHKDKEEKYTGNSVYIMEPKQKGWQLLRRYI